MQIKLTDENEAALKALVAVTERTHTVEANIALKQYLAAKAADVATGRKLLKKQPR